MIYILQKTSPTFVLIVIITPLQVQWLEQYSRKRISVNDTHKLTRYSFKLATLMVVDQYDRGLPAGTVKFKRLCYE